MVSLEMSKQHYSILVMEMCFDMTHGKTKFDKHISEVLNLY